MVPDAGTEAAAPGVRPVAPKLMVLLISVIVTEEATVALTLTVACAEAAIGRAAMAARERRERFMVREER